MPKVFAIGEALIDFIPKEKRIELREVTALSTTRKGAVQSFPCRNEVSNLVF